MDATVLVWGFLSIGVFWVVGVSNRIALLRARGLDAFALVAQHISRLLPLVTEHIEWAGNPTDALPLDKAHTESGSMLQLAHQLQDWEKVARQAQGAPWERSHAVRMTEHGALVMTTWGELRSRPNDLAGETLPQALVQRWVAQSLKLQMAIAHFDSTMDDFNDAISQFPALIIARILGMKKAAPLSIFHDAQ